MKKYKFTGETKEVKGTTLKRIQRITDEVIGGWLESEDNLSHEGNCFIYDEACVYGNAQVSGNAKVYGAAVIFGNACVFGDTRVYGNAKVYGVARVFENTEVFGYARVYGKTKVYGDAEVYGNAKVYGAARVFGDAEICEYARVCGYSRIYGAAKVDENAKVFGKAQVFRNAWVFGNAWIFGNAVVYGTAIVKENWHIKYGRHDKLETVTDLVRAQTGLAICNGFVLAYKRVNSDLSSEYDRRFKYKIGKIIKVKEFDPTNKSCASGLHFSNAEYYPREKDKVTLACWIKLEDIITVQEGKIRAKRCKVIGICD